MNASRGMFGLVAVGIATVFALSGCSASDPAPSAPAPAPVETQAEAQSQAEACGILQEAVVSSTSELQAAFADIQADPSLAVGKIEAVAQALDEGASAISVAEVKASAEKVRDSTAALAALLDGIVTDPASLDVAKLQEASTQVQTDFLAIADVCS